MTRRTGLMTTLGRRMVALVGVLVLVSLGITGPASAQGVPDWCQWIPPEYRQWIPECQGGGNGGGGGQPGGPVEEQFSASGPSSVTSQTVSVPSPGISSTVFYPTDLGAGGQDHPVITWGNGTMQSTSTYTDTLELLASWGFVVVSPNAGPASTEQMVAAADWAVAQNSNSSSVFFENLDTANVGSTGHSGGAAAAADAAIQSSVITATAPVALPDEIWCGCDPSELIDFTELSDPVLLMRGADDFISSDAVQAMVVADSTGPAAKASLLGAGHGGGLGAGGIDEAGNGFQGYLVAWFMHALEDDPFAADAFVANGGEAPEMGVNSLWTDWASENLS